VNNSIVPKPSNLPVASDRQRLALLRDITRRLEDRSHSELRAFHRALQRVERRQAERLAAAAELAAASQFGEPDMTRISTMPTQLATDELGQLDIDQPYAEWDLTDAGDAG
jgi:hypothetical protein